LAPRKRNSDIHRGRRRLRIESLERRELLAVTFTDDVLRIEGTAGDDTAAVDPYSYQGDPWVAVTLNGDTTQYAASAIRKIVFQGLEGDDYFRNSSDLVSHAWGNAGADTLLGGGGPDRLLGGSWADSLDGGAGDDKLYGQGADDSLYGGAGNDSLYGHTGADSLFGEADNDSLLGSSGDDLLVGGDGDDTINGLTGYDEIYGQDGNDLIYGHGADDVISAGAGDDRVYGGGQNDTIFGEGGNDTLFGTSGDNFISGDDGDDRIYGGHDNDDLRGGDGNDLIRAYGGDDVVQGGEGDDQLFGSDGNDTLYGGGGGDYLDGEAGDDGLFGGGAEADTLQGGAGSDRLLTQSGDSINDFEWADAEVRFIDGTSPYTSQPRDWTDADIERTDLALATLHHTAGSARVLRDSYSGDPVDVYFADSFTLGANVAGFNWFTGYERQIHIRSGMSNESFGATVVHEFGHCWDSSEEGNWLWTSFDPLYDGSASSDDFSRSYGQTNSKEDWATNWELFFGYYEWAAPASPSSLLQAKQAAVRDFFAGFSQAEL
jgi:Ca2+-binding RTX toxin-like protein